MRKLGKGQSVVFCVSPEIKTKISALRIKDKDTDIDVSDILCWAVSGTHTDLRRSMPSWVVQGRRFEAQSILWAENQASGNGVMSKPHAEKFLENEGQTIAERYRPCTIEDTLSHLELSQNPNLRRIWERCREFQDMEFSSATLEEEQERELSPEIVQERQVQKPTSAQPATHSIHPDVLTFVTTGELLNGSEAFQPAFASLRGTSAAAYLDVSQLPQDLLVTMDFSKSIQTSGMSSTLDDYQRPVQWILTSNFSNGGSSSTIKHMVVISPYEAHMILPTLDQSKGVSLHLYAPRANLGLRALDKLDLYTMPQQAQSHALPQHLILQLNLFAGQLYFGSFEEYVASCTLLRLAWEKTGDDCVVAADGFIQSVNCKDEKLKMSPIIFLKVLMTKIRRNCESIDKTHVGAMLDGRLLRPGDFENASEGS